jgi:hypothetical protein
MNICIALSKKKPGLLSTDSLTNFLDIKFICQNFKYNCEFKYYILSLYIIFFRLSEYTSVHPAYDTQIYELFYLCETCIAVEFIYYIFQVVRIHFRSPCLRYTNLWVVTCLRHVLVLSFDIIFFRLSEYTSVHPAYDTQIYESLPVLDVYCCWVYTLYFSGCQNTLPFTLPKIHKSMSCYLSETCTAIDCCIDVEQISRSVHVYINLDACNYRLTAGIEKLTFDIPLLQYQFGQKQSFRLMNIFRIEWVINKNYINILGVG